MFKNWDTFGCFEALLQDFEALLRDARNLRVVGTDSFAVKMAVIGFCRFSPRSEWRLAHYEIINTRLQGELSLQELQWYEESAEAISVFACLALGALLGKFQSKEIDDSGFLLGDAHLAGFLALNNAEIYARFTARP